MSATSGTPSARTLLTSSGYHLAALVLLLMVPAGPLRHSARPKELEVVFHAPEPRIEIPAPALPLPSPREATAGLLRPQPVERPKPSAAPPIRSETENTLAPGTPDLPADPEVLPVAEAPAPPKVEKKGILAFRDQFASLAENKVAAHLGADARYRDADDVGPSQMPSRSMLTGNSPGSSGGINMASLSLSVGGGGGGGGRVGGSGGAGGGAGMQGLPIGRATSSIGGGGGGGGGGRPTAHGGPGPSRTDEEIQIVFDRWKASFYRLYNRELRNDPTLQGQMVLRMTIEPDGSVSMCKLQSTDMNAPDLAAQVVNIVRTINFGAKDGVQALTILYPIDFLPATT